VTSFILYRYIARNFLINLLVAYSAIICIASMIDVLEMFRRTADKDIDFLITLKMASMRIVNLAEKLLPYSIMVGTMMSLMRLMRTSELVVVRASGVSVWRFLLPSLAIAFTLGCISIIILNPLSAATLSYYNQLEAKYFNDMEQPLSISSSGLWLRHSETNNVSIHDVTIKSYLMYAKYINQNDMSLNEVIIFLADASDGFVGRIDAKEAKLLDGEWRLNDGTLSIPGKKPHQYQYFDLPTELNIKQIQNSFADPQTLSFWELGDFITALEKAGFSALRHKLYWYSVLITPFTYAAMVLLAAIFSLRPPRRGKMVMMVAAAVIAGFILHFMGGLFHAFGYAGNLSIEASVIAPYLIALLLSTVILLHLEDG
jgi:lipopolysaccharide export system permease protein